MKRKKKDICLIRYYVAYTSSKDNTNNSKYAVNFSISILFHTLHTSWIQYSERKYRDPNNKWREIFCFKWNNFYTHKHQHLHTHTYTHTHDYIQPEKNKKNELRAMFDVPVQCSDSVFKKKLCDFLNRTGCKKFNCLKV